MKKLSTSRLIALSLVFLGAALVFSLCLGRYHLSFRDLALLVIDPLQGGELQDTVAYTVFWYVRVPRTLLVLLSGGCLAMAGTVLQGVFRNPLVSPDIIGVSSGASLGVALAIVAFDTGLQLIQAFAFAGGLLATLFVYYLSNISGDRNIVSLVLAGIIVNSLASACISLLKYVADPTRQLPALEFWLMGGFYGADWNKTFSVLPALLIGSFIVLALRWQVNALSCGEEEALSLGVPVTLVRGILVAACAVLVASVVSVAGIVSWVGLVAPHITRMLAGSNHLLIIPLSFSTGAVMLLIADTLSRSLIASEIPVSIITSIVGAPFLAYLLWKVGRRNWNRE